MTEFLTPIEWHYATKWEQMTILDDPIFGAVMENERLCQELLRRALPELKIDTVKLVERQHTIIGTLTSHAVRYDVYVRDNRQRNFAVEMQIADQKNLPYHLRYYQDMMDTELLRPGEDYRALAKRPTYVIMFCAFDYYGQGAHATNLATSTCLTADKKWATVAKLSSLIPRPSTLSTLVKSAHSLTLWKSGPILKIALSTTSKRPLN